MAASSFEIENAKDIRTPPDYINIIVCSNPGQYYGSLYLNIQKKHLVSCKLDLRGVSTRFNSPDLEASSIEVVAYFPNGIGEAGINPNQYQISEIQGKQLVIKYTSGYYNSESDSNLSQTRVFYCKANVDNFKYKDNLLTIKGVDKVGLMSQELSANYYSADFAYTYNSQSYYNLYSLIGKEIEGIVTPLLTIGSDTSRVSANYPGMPVVLEAWDNNKQYRFRALQYRGQYRKLLANMMNIFRGSDPNNPDLIARRFVFRDAGIPGAGWCKDAVSAWERPSYGNVMPPMNTWELGYSDVADFEETYGDSVEHALMDNPYTQSLFWQSNEIELQNNSSTIITFSEPTMYSGFTTTSGSLTVTGRAISLYAVELTATSSSQANITGKGYIYGYQIKDIYDTGETEPNIDITTDKYGVDVKVEKMAGLHNINGYYCAPERKTQPSYWQSISGLNVFERALTKTLNDCNVKNPKWITFTWRGHPDMQPRDMLIFTEKNGTKNYYEIDNLTIEHKDGGMISTVNAIYKCPYTA